MIFPKPVNGRFNEEKQLAKIRSKLAKLQPTLMDPELNISDGAKNKMREFIDVWDKQLKDSLDQLFKEILRPMVMKSALELDVEAIKDFKSLSKIEELPEFLFKKMHSISKNNTEEDKNLAFAYMIIAESIKAILEYRNLLIDLAKKEESGIFEAYFKTIVDKNVKYAEHVLESEFHLRSRELEKQIRTIIVNKFFEGNKEKVDELRGLFEKLKPAIQDEYIRLFNQQIDIKKRLKNSESSKKSF